MVDITKKFLSDIDILSEEIIEDEDKGYFAIFLCQKIINKYIDENNGSILETIKIFIKIYNDNNNFIKYISLLCIYIIELRIGKTKKDEYIIKNSLVEINQIIKKIDEM